MILGNKGVLKIRAGRWL